MSSTAPDADDIIGTLGLAVWPAIEAVELRRVRIPLLHPHVYAGGEERERDVVLVCAPWRGRGRWMGRVLDVVVAGLLGRDDR